MPLVSGGISSNSGRGAAMAGVSSASPEALERRNCRRLILFTWWSPWYAALVRIGISGAGDANLVVGEAGVRARQLDFRHVAAGAVLFGHRTGARLRFGGVAGAALGVVSGGGGLQRSVGIVAGGAADAGVGHVVAAAVGEAIGLEADVERAARAIH